MDRTPLALFFLQRSAIWISLLAVIAGLFLLVAPASAAVDADSGFTTNALVSNADIVDLGAQEPTQEPTQGQAGSSPPQDEPKSYMDIYGFLMLDMGYDVKVNNPDWFDVNRPTKLPSFSGEFGKNGNTYFGVRQT